MHFTYFSGVTSGSGTNASVQENVTGVLSAAAILPALESATPRRQTSVSLPEILREITLEEFLLAIERVKETQLLPDIDESNDGNFIIHICFDSERILGDAQNPYSPPGGLRLFVLVWNSARKTRAVHLEGLAYFVLI